jgi:hypothetical protein
MEIKNSLLKIPMKTTVFNSLESAINTLISCPKDVKLIVILSQFYQRLKKSSLFRFLLIKKIKIANIKSITINQFTNNRQNLIKQVINQHTPLKITNQDEADFVVISTEDWDNKKPSNFPK